MKKANIPDIRAVANINIRSWMLNCPNISFIATAAPVRVFEIIYREINENPITKVFVAPRRTRNPLLSVFAILVPIMAACPLPKPGRKLQRGEAIIEPRRGLNKFTFGFSIFWCGISVLFFMLVIKREEPKSPVNKGKIG